MVIWIKQLLTKKTAIVSLIHTSNVMGTVNPIKDMIRMAHAKSIPVVVDGLSSANSPPANATTIGVQTRKAVTTARVGVSRNRIALPMTSRRSPVAPVPGPR